MNKKVLITGITGMIGTEFEKQYLKKGYDVYGISRNTSAGRMLDPEFGKKYKIDILDEQGIRDVFNEIKPDIIIHLAAQAFNGESWKNESYTHLVNYNASLNILRAVRDIIPRSKVLLACSSAEYGDASKKIPLIEETPLKPISPYGVSKAAMELIGYQYFKNYNMKVYLPRLFIHVGAGHPPATAIQNFAKQLAMIKNGKSSPIMKVGNLESVRDFIDVRDGVSAMIKLLNSNMYGMPVNICSGVGYKIKDILKTLITISGLNDLVKVVKDTTLYRKGDESYLVGNNKKILSIGWKQKYSIKDTLILVYKDWCNRV